MRVCADVDEKCVLRKPKQIRADEIHSFSAMSSVNQIESEDTRRDLSQEEAARLASQNDRKVTEFRAAKFQAESKKHWDKFYMRNENR